MQRIGIHHYECNHTIAEIDKLFSEFKSSMKSILTSLSLVNANERVNTFYNKIVILPDARGKYILSKHDVLKFFDNYITKISDISEDLVESVNKVFNTVNLAIATHIVNTRIHEFTFNIQLFLGFSNRYTEIFEYRMAHQDTKNLCATFDIKK